jgi:hypothetical protein
MATVLAKIEAILNSRPDLEDVNALMPGYFLIGRPLVAMVEPNYLDISGKMMATAAKNYSTLLSMNIPPRCSSARRSHQLPMSKLERWY